MSKKTDFIDCPQCRKPISSYALVCAHCGKRIIQKDFGATGNVKKSKDQPSCNEDVANSHGWTNVVMLLLVFVAAVGIIFRFQEKFVDRFNEDHIMKLSISRADFEQICQQGLAKAAFFEHKDKDKWNYVLEAYAKNHGYPNKEALLSTCAKAAYKYNHKSVKD